MHLRGEHETTHSAFLAVQEATGKPITAPAWSPVDPAQSAQSTTSGEETTKSNSKRVSAPPPSASSWGSSLLWGRRAHSTPDANGSGRHSAPDAAASSASTLSRVGSVAQQRYCGYFDALVASMRTGEGLPASLPLAAPVLKRVVLSACPAIDDGVPFRPYMNVSITA